MSRDDQVGKETALVTGASWGIGRELARLCARGGANLVLVARSGDRLAALADELRQRHGVATRVVPMDLAVPEAPRTLYQELEREGVAVDILINNAGIGMVGPFVEADPAKQMEMLRLNIIALTDLARLFLPPMVARGRGRILNVASTAAFQPGPFMAVYYASKAYVLSFSEALAEEVRAAGVTVTALCPGPTATEFQSRANLGSSYRLLRLGRADARRVAEQGYRGMMKGRAIVVTGLLNRLLAGSVRFAPRVAVRKISKWLNSRP